jgi:drug/metabolite transporter (DMT)-like permease
MFRFDPKRRAYVYVTVVILLWATVASAFKISLRHIDFLNLVLYASSISLGIFLITLAFQGRLHLIMTCSPRQYITSALLGLVNPFIYYIVLFKAYSLLPAQEAQPLNQTWAIILSVLSYVLLKQRFTMKSLTALLISFAGVVIISTHGDLLALSFSNLPGALLALGSAFFWAVFWLFNIKDRRDPVVKLTLNFLFGAIYILIFSLIAGTITLPSWSGLLGAVYVGAFEMGITFVFWLKALQLSRSTARISNVIYLVPFLSLAVIRLTVGESIRFSTIIGLCFIIGGIILQHYESGARSRPSAG